MRRRHHHFWRKWTAIKEPSVIWCQKQSYNPNSHQGRSRWFILSFRSIMFINASADPTATSWYHSLAITQYLCDPSVFYKLNKKDHQNSGPVWQCFSLSGHYSVMERSAHLQQQLNRHEGPLCLCKWPARSCTGDLSSARRSLKKQRWRAFRVSNIIRLWHQLVGFEEARFSQFIVFFQAYIQGWASEMLPQDDPFVGLLGVAAISTRHKTEIQ